MKQLLLLLAAGLIGGLTALGLAPYFGAVPPGAVRHSPAQPQARAVSHLNTRPGLPAAAIDLREAARLATPAVVHIRAVEDRQSAQRPYRDPFEEFFGDDFSFFFDFPGRQMPPREGAGSGVIYDEEGYIVTNNHVVEYANYVEVTLLDNRSFEARVVGRDPSTDLAVLKIEAQGLSPIRIGNSDATEVGEWVLAVGNPFELNATVTAGIISAKARNINILRGKQSIESFIQTDAAVNPGNSGGALVNARGELIGINTAIASQTGVFSGYSFAIPVNIVTKIADDIIEYGAPQRALVGADVVDLDAELAEELGLSLAQGVVVESLVPGGAAQYAGLLPNDVIIAMNGRPVRSAPELQELLALQKPGDEIRLRIVRDGREQEYRLRLK